MLGSALLRSVAAASARDDDELRLVRSRRCLAVFGRVERRVDPPVPEHEPDRLGDPRRERRRVRANRLSSHSLQVDTSEACQIREEAIVAGGEEQVEVDAVLAVGLLGEQLALDDPPQLSGRGTVVR